MSEPTVAARLFYDDGCGPCRFFARASVGVGLGRVRMLPLRSPEADRDLRGLRAEEREGSFHLLTTRGLSSGEAALLPWVRVTLGPHLAEVIARAPPFRRTLVGVYRLLWEHRRTHGCGVASR